MCLTGRHASIPGPQVQSFLLCQVARPNLFCRDDITVGHAMMTWICTVGHSISVELRDTAAVQTELGGAKLRTLDDWQLLAQPLLDLKHWSFHTNTAHTAKETLIGVEGQWQSVRDPFSSGLLSLFFQSGKDMVLDNNGDEDAKLIAVLYGSR